MEEFDNFVRKNTNFLNNSYISGLLLVFLIIYTGAIVPTLSQNTLKIFNNTFAKLFMFFLIVFVSRKNQTIALMASIAMIVSIIELNKHMYNKENMEIVDNVDNANKAGQNNLTKDKDMKPKSEDGQILYNEVLNAVKVGALTKTNANKILDKIISFELNGVDVLIARTTDGVKRSEEIAYFRNNGTLSVEEAKRELAIVVVAEIIMEMTRSTNNLANNSADNSADNNLADNNVVNYELESDDNNDNLNKLTEEVMRKKQEYVSKNGVEPSEFEMRELCANVLNNYRKSQLKCDSTNAKCGDPNYLKPSNEDEDQDKYNYDVVNMPNLTGMDPSESPYEVALK